MRDYIRVRDIVHACLKAMEMEDKKYRIFNIGSGRGISLNQLIEILKETFRKDIEVYLYHGEKN